MLIVLGGVVLVGGAQRLRQAWKARRAVHRLGEPDLSPPEVEAAAAHGRSCLPELFRILGETPAHSPLHDAAGRAIAALWTQDQLIAEEEQALVRRGFVAEWYARRRYPRDIASEIPIRASYGLPFLRGEGPGITPENLEWSHRVTGARRAALEEFSAWAPGPGQVQFSLVPADFDSNGPHRLTLQARVRTRGLTDAWQLELPHLPFSFEFDPRLKVRSLLALPDAERALTLARAVRLEPIAVPATDASRFLSIGGEMLVRNPPEIVIATPLPCDLAHRVFLEFEPPAGRVPAGLVLLSGQGEGRGQQQPGSGEPRRWAIGPVEPAAPALSIQPGSLRLRACLEPDPDRGWTDPDIRSIWPGAIETGWVTVEIVRR